MSTVTFTKRRQLDYRANESYKSLGTNIQFCGDDIKVIAFTSCTPNEGKSSVSFNLAASFAEIGKKVIMVDADLRKSVLAGRYKVGEVEYGLTHYLSGQKSINDVLKKTNIENMDIIFSGSYCPNPAELLNHKRFEELLTKLKEEYDYVLVDTPPLGVVIDGAIIAKKVDGAVIVIEANAISHRFVRGVKEQLEKAGCKVLGAVLNKVDFEKNSYYGRYYGHYGDYGKEE